MELTIEQALRQGVAAHKEGKLQDAERLYRTILQSQPAHPDANHNLGVVAVSVNKADAALPLFKTALEANPKIEQFWLSYIDALIKEQQFDNAKQVLEQAKKQGVDGERLNSLEVQLSPKTEKPNTAGVSPPQELLNSLLGYYQNGRFNDAEKLAEQITQEFPEHQFAWKVLGAILGTTGRKSEAVDANQTAVALSPQDAEAHSNLGITLQELGRLDEAEASLNQAIALKPDFAEAHFNLGITLKELGRLEEAVASCNQAIALNPDNAKAHFNLGVILQELGRLDEAEASLNQAIALKPDFAEAHFNLGNTLQELGRLDEAEASYNQAIALKPNYTEAHQNLLELLTSYISKNDSSQPIVKVDQEIKEIYRKDKISGAISNNKIVDLFCKSLDIITKHDLNLETDLSQTFRRNSVHLNCKRHMQIFNKFNVIPEFCFGCYKVQVEPRSVIELIKLLVVFDQIKLCENNIRKCMIETRLEISGFYKGYIYCSSVEEAYQIADDLEIVVKEKIGSEVPLMVKRGCSEYAIVFPDYKKINRSETQLMHYNNDWRLVEEDYDSKNSIKNKRRINPSLSCLSLSDVLIIRNWIDYAKGIGDPSAQLLNQDRIFSQRMYKIGKTRLETHLWRDSI
ncbi:MAG: tetratricopeptide repeat protein [Gammaproteobacteria bacterium]